MPVQLDSFSSPAQAAASNPFQQRQDQVRIDARKSDDKDKAKTKPVDTAAAQTQQVATRRANVVVADNQNKKSDAAPSGQQRGGLVNISV
jgi:hypothetical protein